MGTGFDRWSMRSKLMMLMIMALIGLAVVSTVALYSQRDAMLQDRQERTLNISESALGVVARFEKLASEGKLSTEEAQTRAKQAVDAMHYDKDNYVFILDKDLNFLVHPRQKLIGFSLHKVKDSTGQNLGDIFAKMLKEGSGHGFAHYMWKKNDEVGDVPKVTYGTTSAQWGWVVGTGIYLDDVDTAFYKNLTRVGVACVLGMLAMLLLSSLIVRNLLRQLGGEPTYTVEIVREIAAGNLAIDVRYDQHNTTSVLASIAQMKVTLRELLQGIVDGADQARHMAEKISSHAAKGASNANAQSDATTSMAASIEEMTVSINHIADRAKDALERSQHSDELAVHGAEVIAQAVNEMERIYKTVELSSNTIIDLAERTDTISGVMGVIRDVADQTNLLALNAAIEAARAGEQGRGFAVVADEVRKLAERTANATKEIADTIQNIKTSSDASRDNMEEAVSRVKTGVSLAADGGDAVKKIRTGASAMMGAVDDISHALKEQGSASSDIALNVERIAHSASANADIAEETASATRDLYAVTDKLHQMVGRFRL